MKFFIGRRKLFITIGIFIFLLGFFGLAGVVRAASLGDVVNFNVDKGFDASGRTQISSTLVKIGTRLYFYVEKTWWESQTSGKQGEILANLDNLSNEFDANIYPKLTSSFGQEWNPGVDNDPKITVLFESINSTEGGYFREADEYEKLQLPESNEREMLYLSVSNITDPSLKIILGHEFTHLITFNQKNKIFGMEEETWLNEARADYSSTVLGYDNPYIGSNLQQRVNNFIENPSDSVAEWTGTKYDYASASLFTHYLVDHYGVNILTDSLKSKHVGIDSINYALQKSGFTDNFGQIFNNWTIASVLNDCSVGQEYCYLNPDLKNLRISPALDFLPIAGDVSLSVSNVTKNWAGNWQKFIGGNGDLKLDFSSFKDFNFQVPYITEDSAGIHTIKFLKLDKDQKGEINISDFGTDIKSLIIIPSLQTKSSGFDGPELTYPFSYTVKIIRKVTPDDQALMQQLLDQVAVLKQQIAALQGQKNNLSSGSFCSQINNNLSFGMTGGAVSCLQTFLKNQGANIYPEGLITGNFGSLTKSAVIRFQEKYASDILTPVGLSAGTGYVGAQTRIKINQILNS